MAVKAAVKDGRGGMTWLVDFEFVGGKLKSLFFRFLEARKNLCAP
jgi:hypothetical protein